MGAVELQRLTERDDVEVLALFERNQGRGKEVLTNLGLSADLLVDDYERMVSNPDIDAVWLVSPNSFHGPQAIAAMQAGKHVFCEKPVAVDAPGVRSRLEGECWGSSGPSHTPNHPSPIPLL